MTASGRSMRIRTDDQVLVTAGKDKGKSGRVTRVDPQKRKVVVEGLNMVKRHQRPTSMDSQKGGSAGGIIEKEAPIDVSNVMLVDPTDNKPTRVGVRREDGNRVRYSKRTGNAID